MNDEKLADIVSWCKNLDHSLTEVEKKLDSITEVLRELISWLVEGQMTETNIKELLKKLEDKS